MLDQKVTGVFPTEGDRKEQLAAVAHQRTLVWKSARAEGTILADVGGNLGRYIVERCKSGRFELRHQGQPLGLFNTADEAKARAQAGADSARAMKVENDEYFSKPSAPDTDVAA